MSTGSAAPGGGRRRRGGSLYWVFAGAFLAVLVVAGILQGVLVVAFFDPLVERWNAERARVTAAEIARSVESLPDSTLDAEATRLVMAHSRETVGARYVFRRPGARFPPVGPSSRGFRRRPALSDSGGVPPPGRGERAGRGPVVLAREPVLRNGLPSGEIIALGARPRLPFWPGAMSRRILIFLPVALLVAGAGGFVIFRIMVRRLKALESLAAQVAEGRLDVRVEETGDDEIGRLGARLNSMTERLAAAQERQNAEEEVRRRLLADISHELATPLTSIRANAETLLDEVVTLSDEERSAYLRGVLEESDRMNSLIQDLLDLTRLEAGAARLEMERLDWTALCRNTAERFQPRFQAAGLSLRWMGGDAPAAVRADGRRLEQVLENLLVNALRYVPEGGVVELSVEPDAGEGRHRLRVADDGPGLSDEDRPRVFDRFFRSDVSRSTPGSGLGLAIVREIVTGHGGTVRAMARLPRGTVFVVELPAA